MKSRLMIACSVVFLLLLLPLLVAAAPTRPTIVSIEQSALVLAEEQLIVVTDLHTTDVWVRHSNPPLFNRATLEYTDDETQTWRVSFTPTLAESQYVEVWANVGFVLRGAAMVPFYLDTTRPVFYRISLTLEGRTLHAEIITEGEVNAVWVRHGNPERFPRAVRVSEADTTQQWEVSVTLSTAEVQTLYIYANRGFWVSDAVVFDFTVTEQATTPTPTPAPPPRPAPPIPIPTPTPAPVVQPEIDRSNFAAEVFRLTNIERANEGLSAFTWCNTLAAAAHAHSVDMGRNQFMSHTGSDGSTLRSRIDATGISWRAIAENVAQGQTTPEEVVAAWMNSPGYRANILNPNLTRLGVGFYHTPDARFRTSWTQKFSG